jgi:hypothetical protein
MEFGRLYGWSLFPERSMSYPFIVTASALALATMEILSAE